ncbi:hypothetical protein [Paenibacillus mucilaginosus]|uniref:Membrane protein n=3 Tax=Paenibacillus mucilaginosus TaxID=61624 RepID=H6NDG3_9BACL|nr:hypothetical protein [Paenibacillus mucilaginosus]AEI43674.1 membrane protein [Paenibacillus mucilaginosus KNP414]AFC31303.1 membrane protein [Paenibacillus mucilaginosus 3016]AFH63634.1 membrane protein [Paenibacillus mucilaginosus K02]MCG7216914.1 hypothetical protein [Paenibacillus mucilaginosus]WDM25201.1 hypothetical protein KCX80_22340 [Paenibacillus mucilaginosus]
MNETERSFNVNMSRYIIGTVLILLGAGLFLNQGHPMGVGTIFEYYWASLFVLPLGLFFHWLYFSMTAPRASGLLIPGGILVTVGLVCQISTLFDAWGVMWPGFVLAPAVGLFEFYLFGSRNRYLLIPVSILTVISLLFFTVFTLGTLLNKLSGHGPVVAIVLIVIGAYALLGGKRQSV